MPRRPLSVIAVIFGAGVLMIGAAGCGGSDTAAPATTTQVETAAAPAATVTVDMNNNNQNNQNNQNNNNQNNQNNDNQNNDNTNQTTAQQKAECLANNKGYPENCADIP